MKSSLIPGIIGGMLTIALFLFSFAFNSQTEPLEIERAKLSIRFTPPGEITDIDIQSLFFDTTVTFYGDNFTLILQESGTVNTKKANINYESETMALVCGEAKSFRQSDFTEMMTGASGKTTSNSIKVGEYNACLLLSEMYAPGEEGEFSFTLMFPFYSLTGKGPPEMKEALMETLRSFTVYGIDPELTKPNTREIPKKTIEALKKMINEPLENMIDTDVVMTRDDEIDPNDIMNPSCAPTTLPASEPILSVGLIKQGKMEIRRDGFIPVVANAEYWKNLNLLCRGVSPCGEGESWIGGYYTPVKLEWEITSGDASFVEVGCLPQNKKKTEGESVIIRPPMLLFGNTTKGITIKLNAKDEKGQILKTETVQISIRTVPLANKIEVKYEVEISGPLFKSIPYQKPSVSKSTCTLEMEMPENQSLETPKILLPAVPDANKLVFGQRIVLKTAKQEDQDLIRFNCLSSCDAVPDKEIELKNDIVYEWRLEGPGKFEGSNAKTMTGSAVVYRAPDKEATTGKVKIFCKATNRKTDFEDTESGEASISLDIFRPVIVFKELDKNWLPSYDTVVDLSSKLGYYEGYSDKEVPKPGLAHMCTVYNLEMTRFSNYNGICTNWDKTGAEAEFDKYDIYFDAVKHKDEWSTLKGDPIASERMSYVKMKDRLIGAGEIKASLDVKDYAAYAHLKLDYLDDKYWDWDYVVYKIPIDETGNRIGDSAPHNKLAADIGDLIKDDDKSGTATHTTVSLANRGDGYTLFEEYRGFMVCNDNNFCRNTVHKRTHPDRRNLFVTTEFNFSFSVWNDATGVTIYRMPHNDLYEYIDPKSRIVNRFENSISLRGGEQHGLIIIGGLALSGKTENAGRTYWEDWNFWSGSSEFQGMQYAEKIEINKPFCKRGGYSPEEVVAHEIGHACGIPHHGGDGSFKEVCVKNPQNNNCWGSSAKADFVQNGTKFSGNLRCFMRYEKNAFVKRKGSNVRLCSDNKECDALAADTVVIKDHYLLVDLAQGTVIPSTGSMSARNQLCNDQGATSELGRTANNAGNCFSRLRVKTWGD